MSSIGAPPSLVAPQRAPPFLVLVSCRASPASENAADRLGEDLTATPFQPALERR
jgi:hypothetical protein